MGSGVSYLDPPSVALLRALWSLLDVIWGSLKGSLGGAGIGSLFFHVAIRNY